MISLKYEIARVEKSNYHMFDDMIFRRINGREKSEDEKFRSEAMNYDNIFKALDNPNLYVYAALAEGRYVGWISMVYMPKVGRWNGSGLVYVDELWVEPTYRGKGIGKALMKKADDLNEYLQASQIRLYVEGDNDNAIKLYEKCGFITSGKANFMIKVTE